MYRDDCKHFLTIDTDGNGDLYFCRLATNKLCHEAPVTLCEEFELIKKRKWLPQFIKEEEFRV